MFQSLKFSKVEFVTEEEKARRHVLGMWESEAVSHIERNGLIAFVDLRDRTEYKPHCDAGHSYRIRLTIRKGKVIEASIG